MLPEQHADVSFIQESVAAVLDAVSEPPYSLIQLVIMLITGTDTRSEHLRHYVFLLILDIIKSIAGFSNHLAKRLLQRVWEARRNQPKIDSRNIFWMSYVCFPKSRSKMGLKLANLYRRIR
jgi:hypothetical protein